MRHDDTIAHMHFIISLVETVITVCLIVVQMLNARMGYIKVRQAIQRFEHSSTAHLDNNVHLRSIRRWMWMLVAVGVFYLVTCIACFVVFHHLAHLGWTLLSNHMFIITLTILAGLYSGRIVAAVFRLREDQHKVL